MIFLFFSPMFDLLVLSITEKQDAYGYQLSQVIKQVSNTKDSTLYPVLKRLQEQGFLTVYDQSYQGRNRRYYRITESGRRQYRMLSEEWGQTATFSYFPKDNSAYFNNSELTMLQWFALYSPDDTETFMRGFLGRMLFSGDDVYKQVKVLSGGEKVRCMLSRMMLTGANVLLLDQPTNHLDLESITAVNNGLTDFPGNLLFSSQDHQFIQTIANRIIEIHADGTITDRMMTFDEYLEYKKSQEK